MTAKKKASKHAGKLRHAARVPPDPESPPMRVRRFVEEALRAEPEMTMTGLVAAANAWAERGHTHKGYALWPGPEPFGPHYLGLLLREEWAAKIGSEELRRQARYFRANPEKNLADLASETQSAIDAARSREAEKRAREARKRERAEKAKAEQEQKAKVDRERRERDRREREERAAKQARERHTGALQHVRDFFCAAGMDAESDGRVVRIGGTVINVSKAQAARREKLDKLIDEVVWTRYRNALLQSIIRHLDGAQELRAVAGTNGWVLSQDRYPLVVIRATLAKARSMPAMSGNYLSDDETVWDLLGAEVDVVRAQQLVPAISPNAKRRVLTELPMTLAEDVRQLGLDASRQLRTERNLAFGHSVELEYGDGAIRFDPLRQGPSHVELPLSCSLWSDGAAAELRIGGTRDPLHLSFLGDDDDAAVVRGWLLALVGYSQLVCREDLADLQRSRPRATLGAARSRGHPQRAISTPRVATLPGLVPVGRTRIWIASYVAGHRRRLRPGHRASLEARARAAKIGITLTPSETWVSPHVRGVPPDAVLQFRWEAPPELQFKDA